jgi:2-polyprenyl-3-methyl-5-hydroxy-6-metoxy-1,4-benzoquinol methylase
MTLTCNLCQYSSPDWYCSKDAIDVLRCPQCGLIYAGKVQQNEDLAKHYSDQYFEPYLQTEGIHLEKRFKKRIKEIKQYRFPGDLLDIGSGTGFFMQLATKNGYSVKGVELSEYGAQYAKNKLGLTVFQGEIADAGFAQESFDIITLWHILEHVHDPRIFLAQVNRLLKKNGLLALEVPNIGSQVARISGVNWELMAPKEHFYYFNETTIGRYIEMSGFNLVSMRTFYWTTPAMLLRAHAEKQQGAKNLLLRYLSVIASIWSFMRFRSAPSVFPGDVVTVYAVKKGEI